MTLEDALNGVAETLCSLGEYDSRFPYEPGAMGNDYPMITVRYVEDNGDSGGSDEEELPGIIVYAVRSYYPISDSGDGEDGMKVAQEACLHARSTWLESLKEDRSLGGLAYQVEIMSARAFPIEDADYGNLYAHEMTVNIYTN